MENRKSCAHHSRPPRHSRRCCSPYLIEVGESVQVGVQVFIRGSYRAESHPESQVVQLWVVEHRICDNLVAERPDERMDMVRMQILKGLLTKTHEPILILQVMNLEENRRPLEEGELFLFMTDCLWPSLFVALSLTKMRGHALPPPIKSFMNPKMDMVMLVDVITEFDYV